MVPRSSSIGPVPSLLGNYLDLRMAPINVPTLFHTYLHIIVPRAALPSNVTSSSLPSPAISSTPTSFSLTSNGDSSYVETLIFSLLGLILTFLGVILAYLQLRKMNVLEVTHARVGATELS